MSDRIVWIDVFKGLVITFVVVGHANSPANKYFYLFHVAAFFFISGYTTTFQGQRFVPFFLKKARGLLLPYVAANTALFCLVAGLTAVGAYHTFYQSPTPPSSLPGLLGALIVHARTSDLGGGTWFLLVLFSASLLTWLAIWCGSFASRLGAHAGTAAVALVGIAVLGLGMALRARGIVSEYLLDLAPYASFLMICGHLCRSNRILEERIDPAWAIPLSVAAIAFYSTYLWAGVDWPSRSLASFPWPNILASASCIYLTYLLSRAISRAPMLASGLASLGRSTLAILFSHFAILRLEYLGLSLIGVLPKSQAQELCLVSSSWLAIPLALIACAGGVGLTRLLEETRWTRLAFLGVPWSRPL